MKITKKIMVAVMIALPFTVQAEILSGGAHGGGTLKGEIRTCADAIDNVVDAAHELGRANVLMEQAFAKGNADYEAEYAKRDLVSSMAQESLLLARKLCK